MKSLAQRLSSLVLLLLSFALCLAMPARALADTATPTLAITHVPAYGTSEYATGRVVIDNQEAFNPSDYRVTLYVVDDYHNYWVKPRADEPFVDVLSDCSFALDYVSASTDKTTLEMYVLLVPASFTPSLHGFAEAKTESLDYVKITRAADGSGYVVDPADRELPPQCKPSGLSVSNDKIAVDVGLYTSGGPGDSLSDDRIRLILSQVAGFADTARFYRSTGPEYRACQIASSELGLKVVGTALLTGNTAQDQAEMDALIALCNQGCVHVACVGNETLFSGKLTPETLVADINYVRSRLTVDVPVTTSETLDHLRDNPVVCNACDILMPNIYPFWGGASIGSAVGAFQSSLEGLKERMPYKEIVVSETGWPTAGDNVGSAVTGESQTRTYFEGVRQWSLDNQAVVLWFAAADEPWKTDEGSVGGHWGLLDTSLHVKKGLADLALFDSLTSSTISLSNSDVTIKATSYQYDGSAKKPAVSVSHGGATLTKEIDYTVTYQNNVKAGTGRVIVAGMGKYVGSITKSFSITCATPVVSKVENARGGMNVTWKKVSGAAAYRVFCKVGSGGWKKVADTTSTSLLAKTSDGKTVLKTGTKYSFSVRCVLKKGSNAYTSKQSAGKGAIYVASTALSSAKSGASRKATIRWKKVAKASGYKVQYSKKKNFSGAKTLSVKGGSKASAKLSSLTGGKKYYVRVRAYRVVAGKTYYAAWSAAKRVKVKK